MQNSLRVIRDVNADEKVASGSRTKTGQPSQAAHFVDLLPDLDDLVARNHRLGSCQELPGLPEVDELNLVPGILSHSAAASEWFFIMFATARSSMPIHMNWLTTSFVVIWCRWSVRRSVKCAYVLSCSSIEHVYVGAVRAKEIGE